MNEINMELIAEKRISAYHVLSFILALLFCSSLRISLLAIYPFFVLFLFYAYGWKLDRNAIYLLVFVAATWLFSFRHGFFLKYPLVSL